MLRGRDSKRREKKQIDRTFGKRSDSEQKRSELHKGKRKSGKRNDENFYNTVIAMGAVVVLTWSVSNNATGVGIVDDFLIPVSIEIMREVIV